MSVFVCLFFFILPHSFDPVPLSIIKGPVDSNINGAAAQIIAETTKVTKHNSSLIHLLFKANLILQ